MDESFSAVTVEALASGLPVVTTPVTGIPEIVRNGVNGLIVPPNDAPTLADAIAALIANRGLYERLRSNARATVAESFDIRQTSATLHELLVAS